MQNTDRKIWLELNQLPIERLIEVQQDKGRRHLSSSDESDASEFREYWSQIAERAGRLLEDEGRGREVRQLAVLLKEITFSIHSMLIDPTVSYYKYTDVHVIDWYLSPTHAPFAELKRRALLGFVCILRDLSRFESDSLTHLETRYPERLSKDVVFRRVERIGEAVTACRELFASCGVRWPDHFRQPERHRSLGQYAADPLSVLTHLTCFPRTICHDEVVFLRTIHLAELCFFALRVTMIQAIEHLRRQQFASAVHCLHEATLIGRLLHRTFVVLNTMPPEHFIDFREYTERASAVQSRGYQLMDIYFRGVDGRKEETFRANPPLGDLVLFNSPHFVSLKALFAQPWLVKAEGWSQVEAAARKLDEVLKSWRGLHVAFAVKYLQGATPPTGNTSGEPYLRQFLDAGLFSDTVIPLDQLRQLSTDPEWLDLVSIVPPGHRVAPDVSLRRVSAAHSPENAVNT